MISVIMPTYKRLDLLKRAIESVQRQTYEDWELIISDNEEPPGPTWDYLSMLATTSPKIKPFQNLGGRGQASNVNNALSHVQGEWIKPLFDDDVLSDDCLETFLTAVKPFPNVVLAGCQASRFVDGKLVRIDKVLTRSPIEIVEQRYAHLSMYLQDLECGGMPTQMFIRSTTLGSGAKMPEDPAVICVDTWWFSEILQHGDRLHLARALVEEHQGHETTTSGMGEDGLDKQILLLRERILSYIPSELNPPPFKTVEQMVYGVRGLCRMAKRKTFSEGLGLLRKVRRPSAWGLILKWLARNYFPGRFTATPRLRYDFPNKENS